MLRVTLASLRRNTARYVTTVLAIVLGVVFVSGTMVFSDTLEGAFETRVMGSAESLSAAVHSESDGERDYEPLNADILAEVRNLPEVAAADGMVSDLAPVLDADGRPAGFTPPAAVSVGDPGRFEAADGRLPESDDEVAISSNMVDSLGAEIGDDVMVLDVDSAKHEVTVVGTVDFGVEQPYAANGAVVYTEDAVRALTGIDGYHEIDVLAADGYTDAQVTDAVSDVAGGGTLVRTGDEFAEALAENAGGDVALLRIALMLFALVAMVVAGIVIYNTFAILIAQRQRDLALLRCMGARRGQVFRTVLAESTVVGLVASLLGAALGVGAGYLAVTVLAGLFAVATDDVALVVSPTALLVGLVLGTGVTVCSALFPAFRATRVPPLVALRGSATSMSLAERVGWKRLTVGAVLSAVCAGLVTFALAMPAGEVPLVMVVVAGIIAFGAVVVLGPMLVRWAVRAVAPLFRRIGIASELAADNVRRSPKRAATAMIALTVGATLITGYSVVSASLSETTQKQLEDNFPVDYGIAPQFIPGQEPEEEATVAPEVRSALEADDSVGTVFGQRSVTVVDGAMGMPISSYPGATVGSDITADPISGQVSDLAPGKVVLSEGYAEGLEAGDDYVLDTGEGEVTLEIAAVVGDMQNLWGAVVDTSDFEDIFPDVDGDSMLYVSAATDADRSDTRAAVYDAVADDPLLQVTSLAEAKTEFEDILSIALYTISGMLALAIVIALIGIANTLTLSVLERTRESALLRALGLGRRSLRRMLAVEAVVLAFTGSAIGVGLGVFFGWAASSALLSDLVFSLPYGQVAIFLLAGLVAGLLAAVIPARRAASTSITAALAAD
ncbi:FtsX-like permease family protein [Spiractinospora alimapuensis]|uniref:ABC transporter permease n=1 Tax=Spiractinospora alimapuensis TaxID=2820884 RepID=UPI001F295135|nr:FtsX-like permease family protein [Spiractinospora alimapuensis]QVQ50394.1 FtsX-like permease family protein [Spiractinospora alimapuensis]